MSNKKDELTLDFDFNALMPRRLIKRLRNCDVIPKVLLKNIETILFNKTKIIKELYQIVKEYEGENASLRNLEKTLIEFKEQYKIAQSFQHNIFPQSLPENQQISVNVKLVSLYRTSGDFYDVAEIIPNKVYGIFVSDISGHGVSAALVTHMAKLLFTKATEQYVSPKDVLNFINWKISNILNQRSFFTALYTVIDFPNKQILYSAAGHTYNIRYNSKKNKLVKLKTRGMGMVIGVSDGVDYEEKKVDFNIGDRIIIYTDGLIEARSPEGELFGEKRVNETVLLHIDAPSKELIEIMLSKVRKFMQKECFEDDVTIVVIDIKGDKIETTSSRRTNYNKVEMESIVNYYKKSIILKKSRQNKKGVVKDKINLGELFSRKSAYDKALHHLRKAEKLAMETEDLKCLGDVTLAMSNTYLKMGEFDKAMTNLNEAQKYYEKINDIKGLTDSYISIAILYDKTKEPQKERSYLFKALDIVKNEENKNGLYNMLAKIYNNIGVSYANESNHDEALIYYFKTLEIVQNNNVKNSEIILLNNIGDIYRQQAKYKESLKCFHNSLFLLDEINNKELKAVCYTNIAYIHYKQQDIYFCLYFLKKAKRVTIKYKMPVLESLIKGYRAYVNIKRGKIKKALLDLKDIVLINDKIKHDPQQGLLYIVLGILIGDKDRGLSEKAKSTLNFIISRVNKGETDPDWYFKEAIKQSRSPMRTDTHIPAYYEYAVYLCKTKQKEKAKEKLKEALKASLVYGNYSEREVIFDIISKFNLDVQTFCKKVKKEIEDKKN